MPSQKLAFICKRCFNPKLVNLDFQFEDNNDKEVHLNKIEINTWCNKCNNYFHHFMCDPEIAKTISLLNICGYKTKYSCQGHPEFNRKGWLVGDDTYIFVSGVKPLGEGLYTKMCEAGFNEWCIHDDDENYFTKRIDPNNIIELRNLLNSTSFVFYFGMKKTMKRAKQVDNEPITREEKIAKMERYYANINDKLYKKMKEYIREEYV